MSFQRSRLLLLSLVACLAGTLYCDTAQARLFRCRGAKTVCYNSQPQCCSQAQPNYSPTREVFHGCICFLCGCAQESDVTESSIDNTAASSSSQSLDSQASPEIFEKRIEYRDAMRRLVDILERRYIHGSDDYTALAKANIELAEVELAAAVTQEERYAALEKMVEQAKKREDYVQARIDSGAGTIDELALVTASRLRAELKLLEEKFRLGPSASLRNSN